MNEARQTSEAHDDAGKPSPAVPPRRSWYRLHFSTWIVIAAVLAVLTLIVVPGRVNNHGIFTTAPLDYEHGWPFVFMYQATALAKTEDLREFRDKEGLRGSMANQEALLYDVEMQDGPAWLDRDNWPLKGQVTVSTAGLALDLAVILVIAATVAFAYEWWARHHWRYSLRSLLVVTLLIAAVLAWWRFSVNRYDRESRFAASLEEKANWVFWESTSPIWLRTLIGEKYLGVFHYVVSISIHDDHTEKGSFSDADLKPLLELSYLQFLCLDDTHITDAGLKNIEKLKDLEAVSLNRTQITDAGLKYLCNLPRLEFLDLNYTRIEGPGLKYLKSLPCLQTLILDDTQITDDALPYLEALPKLEDLELTNTQISDRGVPYLEALKKLDTLGIKGTKVTAEGVKRLRQSLPNCKIELRE
jgi:hypothetical protein